MNKLKTFFWFEGNAAEAVDFYQSVFPALKRGITTYYGPDMHQPEGTVLTVEFELFGQEFIALNAGPQFKPTPAVSIMVACEDQAEVDQYWDALLVGGEPMACGWITDRYGFAWQITPRKLMEWANDPDPAKVQRVMQSMMTMVKLDLPTLQRAADG